MTIGDYQIRSQVGEGTYGQVYKAYCSRTSKSNFTSYDIFAFSLDSLVALKKVRLENEREGFPITAVREIKLLRQLEHNNIVRLQDIVTESDKVKREIGKYSINFTYSLFSFILFGI